MRVLMTLWAIRQLISADDFDARMNYEISSSYFHYHTLLALASHASEGDFRARDDMLLSAIIIYAGRSWSAMPLLTA